jgi:hypothetical protein
MVAVTCTVVPSIRKGPVRVPRSERACRVLAGVLADDHELVVPEAGHGLVRHGRAQTRTDRHQQLVSHAVPARGVDHPEVVQVDEQDGGRVFGPRQRDRQPVDEQRAVRGVRQAVVIGRHRCGGSLLCPGHVSAPVLLATRHAAAHRPSPGWIGQGVATRCTRANCLVRMH